MNIQQLLAAKTTYLLAIAAQTTRLNTANGITPVAPAPAAN